MAPDLNPAPGEAGLSPGGASGQAHGRRVVRLALLAATSFAAGGWGAVGEAPEVGPRLSREGWTAASSVSCSSEPPPQALDGRADTRFSTCEAQRPGQWVQVDMQQPRVIAGLALDAGASAGDYPRAFNVYAGNDRADLGAPIAQGAGVGPLVRVTFPRRTARYIKVVQTGKAARWWSIHELDVFGAPP